MTEPVRILILDDSETDTELIIRELNKDEIPFTSFAVDNKIDFVNALKEYRPDLVLSDFNLPNLTGLDAIDLVQSLKPTIPLIIVTGDLDEQTAIQCIQNGAWDYVLKDNLARMPRIVRNALIHKNTLSHKEHEQTVYKKYIQQFESILSSMQNAMIVVYDYDGVYTQAWVSPQIYEHYGISADMLVGKSLSSYYSPKDAINRITQIHNVFDTGETINDTFLIKLPKGEFWLDITLSPLRNETKKITGVIGFLLDVTERTKAENELIRLATAFEQVAECIVITDTNANIQYVNPVVERITGFSRKELLNQNCRIFNSQKHDKSFFTDMWKTILSGDIWNGHIFNQKKDGTVYEDEVTISPIRNTRGSITNYVAVKRDVTNEVKMEKQLRQAQKMEAIGTLAGGIAHDFNNILAAILGYTELSQRDLQEDSKLYKHLQQVLQAGYRAKDLIKQILAFSRQGQQEVKPLQISLIIKEVLKLLRASLPTTIEIRQNIRSHKSLVFADPTQIHQLIMNLCTNAAHAMRHSGGILEVSMSEIEITPRDANHYHGLSAGPFIKLSVTDSGHGMAPEISERIFEPYFTTKKPGEGTGMGLSVVHGIVKSHNGDISVYSEIGKGTTFNIFLPRIEEASEEKEEQDSILPHGSENILFVDDEVTLVEIGQEMLEQLGYNVIAKSNSTEALELFEQHPYDFDLIITDQTMPSLTGAELAKKILEIRPEIPIVLCTGFSEVISEEKAKKIGIHEFIMKPIFMKEIAFVIRKLLDHETVEGK